MTISTRDTSYDLIFQAVNMEDTLRFMVRQARSWAANRHDPHMAAIADAVETAAFAVERERNALIEEHSAKVDAGEVDP